MFGRSQTIHLAVEGMTCGNCVRHVTEALERVKGVKRADVSLSDKHATVTAKEGTELAPLVAAVKEAGYAARAAE